MQSRNAHRFAPACPGETHIFGACAPGWHSAASHDIALADWLDFMQAAGVTRVCSLLASNSHDEADANIRRYQDALGKPNVCHAPTVDGHLIPVSLLRERILPFLVDAARADEQVVVHCLDGLGRTGQVLGAWLVYTEDCSPERAIDIVQSTGRDPTHAVEAGKATLEELHDLLTSVRTVTG